MSGTMLLWATFLPPLVAGLLALAADAFDRKLLAVWIAVAGMTAGGVVALYGGWTSTSETINDTFLTGGAFSTVPGVVGVLGAVAVAGGSQALLSRRNGGTLAALVSLGAFAGGLTACSIDLVALFLVLEITALAAYALVSAGGTRRSDEAALKYYVQGAVATGLLVFGLAVLVGLYTPTGSYIGLAAAFSAPLPHGGSPALLGMVFIVAGLAFKAGAAPFHSWAPDAYQTAPSESAAFLAGPLKLAFLFAAALLLATTAPLGASAAQPLGQLGGQLLPIVGSLGVLSVLVGSLAALRQSSYVRMLGYAGVAQVGYAMLAMSAVSPTAVAIFGTTYAVAACGAFLAALAFTRVRPTWDGTVEGLSGIGRTSPALGAAVCLLMVSLAGIPPLLGFWGKFQVLVVTIGAAGTFSAQGMGRLGVTFGVFAAAVLVGSVVSVAYYGRVMRAILAKQPADGLDESAAGGGSALLAVVVLAVVVVVLGLLPLITGLAVPLRGFMLN